MKLISNYAERLLLYAVMEREDLRRYALPRLDYRLFGLDAARSVFDRLVALAGNGKDIPSVRTMAMDPGLSNDGRQLLQPDDSDITKARLWTLSDVKHAVETLKHYYQKRTLYELAKKLSEDLDSSARVEIENIVAGSQKFLADVNRFSDEGSTRTLGPGGNVSDNYVLRNLRQNRGEIIKTGFNAFDSRVGGWRRGNLVMLTAMRGKGKSVFAKSLGINMFYQGLNVYTCNMEMQEWEYLVRFFAETTKFSQRVLRRGFSTKTEALAVVKFKRQIDAWARDNNCRWTLDTVKKPRYGPADLHQSLKHQGYDVVIVDYLSLLDAGRKELWENIYASTKYLKMMAKDLNALVIVLGQLNDDNRAKYARAGEEDCDAWLYWDIIPGEPAVAFKHGKARDYEPFRFSLVFDGQKTRFLDPEGIPEHTWNRIVNHAKTAAIEIREQDGKERGARERIGLQKKARDKKNKERDTD